MNAREDEKYEVKRTCDNDRNLGTYVKFRDAYGHEISVQDSSAATMPCVWIFVEGRDAQSRAKGAAHLTVPMAIAVRDALELWLGLTGALDTDEEPEDENPPLPSGDGFVRGLGTVRACIDCGCLVAGGPTRCKRCVRDLEARCAAEGDPRFVQLAGELKGAHDALAELTRERDALAKANAEQRDECVLMLEKTEQENARLRSICDEEQSENNALRAAQAALLLDRDRLQRVLSSIVAAVAPLLPESGDALCKSVATHV